MDDARMSTSARSSASVDDHNLELVRSGRKPRIELGVHDRQAGAMAGHRRGDLKQRACDHRLHSPGGEIWAEIDSGYLVKVLDHPQLAGFEANPVGVGDADADDGGARPAFRIHRDDRSVRGVSSEQNLAVRVAAMPFKLNSPDVSAAGPLSARVSAVP